jgi:hypothetical protein
MMMGTATKRDIFSIPATGKSVNILYAHAWYPATKKSEAFLDFP